MASPAQRPVPLPSPPPTLLRLTEDILADIFLRLPSVDALVRTATVCVNFRRIITDRSFLRRFRSLHPPPLIGVLYPNGFSSTISPHPSAPAARALVKAADFSFGFLPFDCRLLPRDTRDGLVLFALDHDEIYDPEATFMDLTVCDPLSQRYVLLPPFPKELDSSAQQPRIHDVDRRCEPFLAPAAAGEEATEASFRVFWIAQCTSKLFIFVFSSHAGEWSSVSSRTPVELGVQASEWSMHILRYRHYAGGCFYWMDWMDRLLVFDTRSMEFSTISFQPSLGYNRQFAIVEAGEHKLALFTLRRSVVDKSSYDLWYSVSTKEGQDPNQFQLEKVILLPPKYSYCIMCTSEGHILLLSNPSMEDEGELRFPPEGPIVEGFTVNVQTLQFERACPITLQLPGIYMYTGFPPSLLSPSA